MPIELLDRRARAGEGTLGMRQYRLDHARIDHELAIDEELDHHHAQKLVVGLLDMDRRREAKPRQKIGRRQIPQRRLVDGGEQEMRAAQLRGVEEMEERGLIAALMRVLDEERWRRQKARQAPACKLRPAYRPGMGASRPDGAEMCLARASRPDEKKRFAGPARPGLDHRIGA